MIDKIKNVWTNHKVCTIAIAVLVVIVIIK
jgi:hypothetical protein